MTLLLKRPTFHQQDRAMVIFRSPLPDVQVPDIALHQYVFRDFDKYRNRLAVIDNGTGAQMTYGELGGNVRRMASGLVRHGVSKGSVLAIISSNSPEWIMTFFATVSVGAVVTTMNPSYTSDEIQHQLDDSGASFVFTTHQMAPLVTEATKRTKIKPTIFVTGSADGCVPIGRLLGDDGSLYPQSVALNPREDLAVLPYSSGTTGLPKGVMLTHSITVAGIQETLDFESDLIKENFALLPFYHIYGMVFIMMRSLVMGKTILTLDKFEPQSFLETLQKYKIKFVKLVPPLVVFLAKAPIVEQYDLSSLRHIFSGGAPLGVGTVQDLKRRLPNIHLHQGWGMTETVGVATLDTIRHSRMGTVGVLRPSNEAQIVDVTTGKPLGTRQEGEVWMRGPNMLLGYWKRPQATQNTIVHGGWVRTGDIGYFDEDGFLYIVDRLKELIKVKGFQVAPAELEDLLLSHPGVADAAVIGVPDPSAGELPKAFVVRKETGLTPDHINAYVDKKVAPYKRLKGGIQFVKEIPKSPSGKILRRQLRQQRRLPSKL